jgi:signal transduction histidine kinase
MAEASGAPMSRRSDTRRILLVEDNPDDRSRVHRMLRDSRRKYEITDAATGAEAIEQIRALGDRLDCVVLDHRLPDMDGAAILRALIKEYGRPPVAVTLLTGHEDDTQAAAAIALGAEDYLLKDSITPHSLMRSIENVVDKFEIREQLELQRATMVLRNASLETMHAELEDRLTELSAANHARDRFIAMMSHEMRTPLNAILGYVELLELEIEGHITDGQRRNLDRIRVGSRHLLDLINDVLDLARADARKLDLDLRPVDINAAAEEITALLEASAAKKGLSLQLEPNPSLPLVAADLQRLRQILTNLVANAIKFTDAGDIRIRPHLTSDPRIIAIDVADTGIGIEPDTLGYVFKEFYQANNSLTRPYGGSGLGLAIAQRLARAMNGEITVASEPGKGSVFTLTLPAAVFGSEVRPEDVAQHDARMARHQRKPEPEELPGAVSVPVVAFADDRHALEALARRVSPAVRLEWTTDPAEVPSLVMREHATLVLIDISASNDAAWQVAQTLADMQVPTPPAILLLPEIIGSPAAGTPPSAVDLGWVALVPKPFTPEQLNRAVFTAAGRTEGDGGLTYDVLVIDDDEDSRRVAGRFLRERGARVRECVDGESGLAEMRLRPPDVAVLDLMMPVLDGFGVLATMRADALLASIPVVVLTAKTLTEAERQFLSRTAVRVLQKGEHRLSDIAALVLRAAISARKAGEAAEPA